MWLLESIGYLKFPIQILLTESVFAFHWSRKKGFVIRSILSFLIYCLCSMALHSILQEVADKNEVWNTFFYIGVFFCSLILMKINFVVPVKEILFAGVCGYATEHITFACMTIISHTLPVNLKGICDSFLYLFLPYILAAVLVYYLFIYRYKGQLEIKDRDGRMILLAFVVLFVVVFLSILVDRCSEGDAAYLRDILCKIYAVLSAFLIIFVAFYMTRQNRILHEREIMEEMLHNLREQQELSRENINIINIKCHDLKYRISKISAIEDKDDQEQYIDEIKRAIAIYDNTYHTGNDALDLVLTEKSLVCGELQIKLSCIVDGLVLDFINSTDVYALFGNALDNAIESVRKQEDEQKRIISMRVEKRIQGVHIHLDNFCDTSIQFEDGLPVTTKSDKTYHGFGVKSIKYIVEKYHGDLLMQVKNQHFILDILFQSLV